MIVFIYREEVYDQDTPRKNIADINIAKQRNGPDGRVPADLPWPVYPKFENFMPEDRGLSVNSGFACRPSSGRQPCVNNLESSSVKAAPGCPVHGRHQGRRLRARRHRSGVVAILDAADAFAVARLERGRRAAARRALPNRSSSCSNRHWQRGGAGRGAGTLAAARRLFTMRARSRCTGKRAPAGPPLPVWLKIDTGMGRLGIAARCPGPHGARPKRLPAVCRSAPDRVLGVMTHLALRRRAGEQPATAAAARVRLPRGDRRLARRRQHCQLGRHTGLARRTAVCAPVSGTTCRQLGAARADALRGYRRSPGKRLPRLPG